MDAPKQKSSLLLPALGLMPLGPMRLLLEMITGGRETGPTPDRPRQRQAASQTSSETDKAGSASAAMTERRIGERAFQIWLDEGRPDGRHHEHWSRAEAELGGPQK